MNTLIIALVGIPVILFVILVALVVAVAVFLDDSAITTAPAENRTAKSRKATHPPRRNKATHPPRRKG